MRVNVRNIVAGCPKCGGLEFDPLARKNLAFPSQAQMRCSSCGAISTYIELMMQIANRAVELSAKTLEDIRRRRGN